MTPLETSFTDLSATLSTNLSASIYFDQNLDKNDSTPWPIVEINILSTSRTYFGPPYLNDYTVQLIYSFSSSLDRLSLASVIEREAAANNLMASIQAWWHKNQGILLGPLSNISTKHDVYENGEYGNLSAKISRVFSQFQIQIKDN